MPAVPISEIVSLVAGRYDGPEDVVITGAAGPVSYTHLTLPTILRV